MSRKALEFSALGKRLKLAAVPLVLASLSACATGFDTSVSRFQSQMPAPAGQTFAVVPENPALEGGLEFAQYARLVEGQMVRLGYAPSDPAHATMIVRFDYGVDRGRERLRSTAFHDPFWGPWYGYHGFGGGYYGRPYRFGPSGGWAGGWNWGWYDPWFDNEVESYTIYTSGVSLKIDRKADGTRLFEGKAEAVSTSNRLQYLVPNLVEAMFTGFPGHSGETVRITVAPEHTRR
ncbi:DUF4136 domain-containing protein [Novosphingobium bradum]|uniref:DUF4136 domain-containing protein n=1 Tax=Novosphingobium bradum TaxID=1737444 RepID=A0ABV7ILX5_9SPHN